MTSPYSVFRSLRSPVALLPCALLVSTATAQHLTHATLDSGGGRSSGGTITNDASLGGIGGEIMETPQFTARAGFVGQLWDPVSLDLTPQPASLPESSALQLAARLTGDDGITQPPDLPLVWESASSFLNVDSTGLATSTLLPGDQSAIVTARSGGLTGSAILSLVDLTDDDYGLFASDGLDDAWQWTHFAGDPENGQPADDPDHDGQDNAFEFLAGTTPRDGGSFLRTRIEAVPGQPDARQLFFSPWRPDRIYTWEFSTDLEAPWSPVTGTPPDLQPDGEARATDGIAIEPRKFYRLNIEGL